MNRNIVFARRFQVRRGLVFGVIIVTALFAFEMFNFSTTEFALEDLLGDLSFAGIAWATILAIAFCGIDFAGIARLFTPTDQDRRQPAQNEAWYLFGAWLLAATMNAMLTWWGVSLAILERQDVGNAVASRGGAPACCTGLRRCPGLADPGADYRHILCGRRSLVLAR